MSTTKEYNRNTRVAIDNMVPWDMYFHSDITRYDYMIPAGAKNHKLLTLEIIENEIAKGNTAFVGVDGMGNHAPLRICDQDIYKYLFDTDTDQSVCEWENVKEIIMKIDDRLELEKKLKEIIVTKAEARTMMVYAANEIDWSNLLAFKKNTFEGICIFVMKQVIYNV